MLKAKFGYILPGAVILLTLGLGLTVFLRADVIESKSHPFLVERVWRGLSELSWFNREPHRHADMRQALADACHHCRPPGPQLVPHEASYEIDVALRGYAGAVLDLYVGILSLLAANFAAVFFATLIARYESVARRCATTVVVLVALSEIGGSLAYLVAPSPWHSLVLRFPMGLATGWGIFLGLSGLFCTFLCKFRTAHRDLRNA
jgi:hypothetical protein